HRTITWFLLLTTLGLATATPALAQPRETPEEYRARKAREKALRDDIRNHLAEHARFEEGATGFEGMWRVTGTRSLTRNGETQEAGFGGDWVIKPQPDGSMEIEGKAMLTGRTTGAFSAKGTVTDGVLVGTYKATIAGEGELRIERRQGGLIIKLAGKVSGN